MSTERRAFSNSELRVWKRCHRKWWLSQYRQLRQKREGAVGARELGTRIHTALAGWYVPDGEERADPMEVLERTIAEDLERVPEQAKEIAEEADLARAMVSGYMQYLEEEGVDAELEVIGSEQELLVEIGQPRPWGPVVVLVAKLDVRVRRLTDGLLFYMDHKTVGSLTEPLKMLHLDEQMLHYLLVERVQAAQTGAEERTAGGLYNMLRKVKRTARAKPPFYGREFVTHNDHELRHFWTRVLGTIDEILDAEERLADGADPHFVVPPNPTRDCTWDCDFYPVCPMFDDGSDAELFLAAGYEVGDPYERYQTTDQRSDV